MEAKRTIARVSLVFFSLACLCAAPGCKRSQEVKAPTLTASELNLPGLTPEQKKLHAERLAWNYRTLVGDYDRLGSKNAKWDRSAHSALELFAQVRAYGPDVEGFPHTLQYHVEHAVEQGCDDPMVRYLYTRFRSEAATLSTEEINRAYGTAAERLAGSGYAPIRKFYATLRAYQCYFAARKANPENAQTAVRYRNEVVQHFFNFLEEKDLPVGEVDDACAEYVSIIEYWNDEKELYDRLEAVLREKWPKAGFAYVTRGNFYVNYAWEGRSSKAAREVTKEQWRLFGERLATAEAILDEGATNAPSEGRIPALMIKVVSGQGKDLDEMQRWFERAMEVDTNNYTACKNMLYFLMPQWGGSREMMLALGRRCVNSDKWGGTVPLILVDAHYDFNRRFGPPDGSYWLEPDVWPDLKAAYEKFFAQNPNAKSWRSYYARYAFWCNQPEALKEQLELAGDNLNEEVFGSRDDYYRALAMAKKVSGTVTSTETKQ